MTWHENTITVPFEYVEPISYLFDRYGHGMSMEVLGANEVLLRTYLPSTSRQRLAPIEVGVKLVGILQPLGELLVDSLDDDEDWHNAWKSHFHLLKLGRHLVIKPSWIDYQPEPEDRVIDLDPGLAFGTGYHPTTYTCLEVLERLVHPGAAVLDLGTGSGILTIAAIKLGAAKGRPRPGGRTPNRAARRRDFQFRSIGLARRRKGPAHLPPGIQSLPAAIGRRQPRQRPQRITKSPRWL